MSPESTAAEIIRLISEGKSARKAAEEVGIPESNWRFWVDSDPDLAARYARAREERGFVLAEQTLEIADDPNLDPNDKRVRIDARKWFASKLNPKSLGDKVTQEVTGEGGGPVSFKWQE